MSSRAYLISCSDYIISHLPRADFRLPVSSQAANQHFFRLVAQPVGIWYRRFFVEKAWTGPYNGQTRQELLYTPAGFAYASGFGGSFRRIFIRVKNARAALGSPMSNEKTSYQGDIASSLKAFPQPQKPCFRSFPAVAIALLIHHKLATSLVYDV